MPNINCWRPRWELSLFRSPFHSRPSRVMSDEHRFLTSLPLALINKVEDWADTSRMSPALR